MIHLSLNNKLKFPSFDTNTDICSKNCDYADSKICYARNNPRMRIYLKKKYANNEKLLNSKNFVSVIKKEILLSNFRKVRFFSSGDLYELSHLEKIIQLCQELPKIDFWLSTHNDYVLNSYYEFKRNTLDNLNIILSNKAINQEFPEFLKLFWNTKNIYTSQTTNKKNKSNCHSSINHESCGSCENCFNKMNITYFLHGKYAEKRLKEYEK